MAAGRLHRVARGVYAVGHVALSRHGTFLAAVLEAGEGAALGYLAATEHWEVRRYRAPLIDVVVPKRRRVKTATRIHRTTLHPRDVTTHKGIPVTTIARTLVDLTDVLSAHEIANVIHEAAFRRRFSATSTPANDVWRRLAESHTCCRRRRGSENKLVVEIDGPGHARPQTKREDARRDAILRAAGYEVVRLSARPDARQARR